MAEAVKAALLIVGLLGSALPLSGMTAGLTDPTLPPTPPAARTGAVDGATPERAPARLQMVIRGPGETRVAVIDGALAREGDRIVVEGSEARVARITDHAVTLTHGDARRTLELLPSVSTPRAARPQTTRASTPMHADAR